MTAAILVALPAPASAEDLSPAGALVPDPEDRDRRAEAARQRSEGLILAAIGGLGLAAGGLLIHRGVTACDRWSRDEDEDDDYLCVFAEMGYDTLGAAVAIAGTVGVTAGIIHWRRGAAVIDLGLHARGGASARVSWRF
jgi:hypothetical protein